MEDNNAAVTCSLNEKDSEIHKLKRIQTKMKEKIRGFNSNEEEADKLRQKLRHLEHVEIIVNGVEADVKRMLEDNAGYTPQQLTYLVLLRQQLDSSKQTNEKLKRSLADLREKLIRTERVSSEGKNEIDMLKLELSQAEARNVSLKRKCDTLIKAMNSPKGVASSLASRFIHQSPAPDTVTPLSTPATAAGAVNTSLDLFNETDQNDIKLALDFEEEENSRKKPKFVSSKAMLTQEHELNNAATLSPTILTTIKPKSTLRLKTKGRDQGKPGVKPLGTISSNLPPADSTFTRNLTSSGSNFRKGFDGLGGQTQAFNRTKSAMQFNIFKKPPVKANKKEKTLTNQTSLEDFILLD
ncbi:E3 ubiquitin-protein ligase TRAIP-like isoform X2 [Watersipora subatra]